jgi:hypothetical protein
MEMGTDGVRTFPNSLISNLYSLIPNHLHSFVTFPFPRHLIKCTHTLSEVNHVFK